jgi:hypothetical protein
MKLETDVDRAAATRRAVSRTAFSKAVPRGEGARSGVLPAYQTRGGGTVVGGFLKWGQHRCHIDRESSFLARICIYLGGLSPHVGKARFSFWSAHNLSA